jgi:hypothetical protein
VLFRFTGLLLFTLPKARSANERSAQLQVHRFTFQFVVMARPIRLAALLPPLVFAGVAAAA